MEGDSGPGMRSITESLKELFPSVKAFVRLSLETRWRSKTFAFSSSGRPSRPAMGGVPELAPVVSRVAESPDINWGVERGVDLSGSARSDTVEDTGWSEGVIEPLAGIFGGIPENWARIARRSGVPTEGANEAG